MTMIKITFDSIEEAMVALNAVKQFRLAKDDFADEDYNFEPSENGVNIDETPVSNSVNSVSTTTIDATAIQGIIDGLVDMDEDELEDMFGEGNNKPYRVLKNFDFEVIKDKLGNQAMPSREIEADLDDVKSAISVIIKDVSVGGLSHAQFNYMFDVKTSKVLFKRYKLDEIVKILKDNDII